jgi:glycosyltransferase involved in cell wall biosynthesis
MMKKLLIISPHFPPINAPDMHRIRMSLPYYVDFNWHVEIVTVKPKYIEGFRDLLFKKTIPENILVHEVNAFPTWLTRKFGLGSLSMRSFVFYFFKVNSLLKRNKYDLIFFSTTMFHIGALGPYWKKRFNVPYVVDLQDPWRNDYYLNKPVNERPRKFWFSYLLLKWTENISLPSCSGIISVSDGYVGEILTRYPQNKNLKTAVIPFAASEFDFEILLTNEIKAFDFNNVSQEVKKVVYVGAITPSFIPIIQLFFEMLIDTNLNMSAYHFYFLGTSYSELNSVTLVENLATKLGISKYVTEQSTRISYFQTLATLKCADLLFIPGSLDENYNASKVYNSILSKTPIFSIFHNKSEVKKIIEESNAGIVVGFEDLDNLKLILKKRIFEFVNIFEEQREINIPSEILAPYRTHLQCDFFDSVLVRPEF